MNIRAIRRGAAGLAALISVVLLPVSAVAQDTSAVQGVRIGLTYSAGVRPGLYVLPMLGARADSIRAIITRDIDFGDRISVIAPDSGTPPTGRLNYPLYGRLGAAAVLQLSLDAGGGLKVVLHEVASAQAMNTRDYPLPGPELGPDWRMALHAVADEIERWITGVQGVAATRILFTRGGTLWVVDSDGQNAHAVPGVGSGLDGAWHPSGRTIGYTEMNDDGTRIVVREMSGARTRRIAAGPGSNITPAFSPDGRHVAYAWGEDGTDIFLHSLEGDGGRIRVTAGRGSTEAQPTFSPDGRRVVFTSFRLGRPELYITDADGANTELLTTSGFGDQLYRADPSWSPDGRFVAFSSQIEGRFQITTIGLRDRGVKQHTIDGINEDPSWAPDARHLVFTSNRGGTRQLWVLDTESGRMRQLTRGEPARMAAWSPRLADVK